MSGEERLNKILDDAISRKNVKKVTIEFYDTMRSTHREIRTDAKRVFDLQVMMGFLVIQFNVNGAATDPEIKAEYNTEIVPVAEIRSIRIDDLPLEIKPFPTDISQL